MARLSRPQQVALCEVVDRNGRGDLFVAAAGNTMWSLERLGLVIDVFPGRHSARLYTGTLTAAGKAERDRLIAADPTLPAEVKP